MTYLDHIEGILFDKDGTLFDFSKTWSNWLRSVLLHFSGGDFETASRAGRNIGFDLQNRKFRPNSRFVAGTPQDMEDLMKREFNDWDKHELVEFLDKASISVSLVEAVPLSSLLERLKSKGLKLGVATNDSEEVAREHLKMAGILDKLDFVAGFDSGYGPKPNPEMLTAFCRDTGIEPNAAIMVGDSRHDLVAASRANLRPIGVLTGVASREDLAPYAHAILRDIGQLPDWLEQN